MDINAVNAEGTHLDDIQGKLGSEQLQVYLLETSGGRALDLGLYVEEW